jgi:hypothetical protein
MRRDKGKREIGLLSYPESKLTVHFIYTFSVINHGAGPLVGELPSVLHKDRTLDEYRLKPDDVPSELKESITNSLRGTGIYTDCSVRFHVFQDCGWAPHLNARCPCLYVDAETGKLSRDDRLISKARGYSTEGLLNKIWPDFPFTDLKIQIRLLGNGTGAVRVTLQFSKDDLCLPFLPEHSMSISEIWGICELAPSITSGEVSLEKLEPRFKKWNLSLSKIAKKTQEAFIAGLPDKIELAHSIAADADSASSADNLKLLGSTKHCGDQYPFTVVQIEGYANEKAPLSSLTKPFSGKTLVEKNLEAEISTVLLRYFDWRTLDRHFAVKNNASMDSLYCSENLYLNISFRSCLAILDKSWLEHKTMVPWTESLLDTVALLRTRWHQLVVSNLAVAAMTFDLVRRQRQLGSQNGPSILPPLNLDHEFLARYIELRGQAVRALEHPITYRRSLGAFAGLYDRGVDRFSIAQLQESLSEKLQAADRLYQHSQDLTRKMIYRDMKVLKASLEQNDD